MNAQALITGMMLAWIAGWLMGLSVGIDRGVRTRASRRSSGTRRPSFAELLMPLPRDRDPDWRRSFTHENTNRPSGPPPLKFRRGDTPPPSKP